MKGDFVTLSVSDGSTMNTYVAYPEGTPKGGLLIFQEVFGVNSYIRSICDRFAKEGYVAAAPELFHRTAPGFEANYDDEGMAEGRVHSTALTSEGLEADIRALYDFLIKEAGSEKIASVGFCMGGRVSFIANAVCPLRAAVSFYGSRIAPDFLNKAPHLSGPMLFFWGGKDKAIPREDWNAIAQAMSDAGKEYSMVEMGEAGHGFFCDQRASYHKESAELAWPLTLQFLNQKLT